MPGYDAPTASSILKQRTRARVWATATTTALAPSYRNTAETRPPRPPREAAAAPVPEVADRGGLPARRATFFRPLNRPLLQSGAELPVVTAAATDLPNGAPDGPPIHRPATPRAPREVTAAPVPEVADRPNGPFVGLPPRRHTFFRPVNRPRAQSAGAPADPPVPPLLRPANERIFEQLGDLVNLGKEADHSCVICWTDEVLERVAACGHCGNLLGCDACVLNCVQADLMTCPLCRVRWHDMNTTRRHVVSRPPHTLEIYL